MPFDQRRKTLPETFLIFSAYEAVGGAINVISGATGAIEQEVKSTSAAAATFSRLG